MTLDGGFGSRLEVNLKVAKKGPPDPLWSARALHNDQEAVVKTHLEYLEAGADIIETNTYQTSADLLRTHLGSQMEDPQKDPHLLMEKAVHLALEAVEIFMLKGPVAGRQQRRIPLVAGSLGPYGACLSDGSEYTGSYLDGGRIDRSGLKEWHLDRIKRMQIASESGPAGISVYAIETIPSFVEALAVLDALMEFPGSPGCWISFQCRNGGRTTARGEPVEEAFRQVRAHPGFRSKVVAVGCNCLDPDDVEEVLRRFNAVQDAERVSPADRTPYVVYPNRGDVWDVARKVWVPKAAAGGGGNSSPAGTVPEDRRDDHPSQDDQPVLSKVGAWMALGANIIGGCCTVGPDLIRNLSQEIAVNMFEAVQKRRRDRGEMDDDFEETKKRLAKKSHEELKKLDQGRYQQENNQSSRAGTGASGLDDFSTSSFNQVRLQAEMEVRKSLKS